MGNSGSRGADYRTVEAADDAAPAAPGAAATSSAAGETRTPRSFRAVGAPDAPPAAAETGIRVVCPRCRMLLLPPAALFRCPGCDQVVQLPPSVSLSPTQRAAAAAAAAAQQHQQQQAQASVHAHARAAAGAAGGPPFLPPSAYPNVRVTTLPGGRLAVAYGGGGGGGGYAGGGFAAPMGALEQRVRGLLARLPPDDPHFLFLRALLDRLPRAADGSLDQAALAELERQVSNALRGAPQALIDLLPTREFAAPAQRSAERGGSRPGGGDGGGKEAAEGEGNAAAAAAAFDEQSSCAVCMSTYEQGETLRTLPCLHSFHRDCIDPWLKSNKTCPICKLAIDADVYGMVTADEAHEAERSARALAASLNSLALSPGAPPGGAAGATNGASGGGERL